MLKERDMKRYKDLSKEVEKGHRKLRSASKKLEDMHRKMREDAGRSKLHDKMKPGRVGEKKDDRRKEDKRKAEKKK